MDQSPPGQQQVWGGRRWPWPSFMPIEVGREVSIGGLTVQLSPSCSDLVTLVVILSTPDYSRKTISFVLQNINLYTAGPSCCLCNMFRHSFQSSSRNNKKHKKKCDPSSIKKKQFRKYLSQIVAVYVLLTLHDVVCCRRSHFKKRNPINLT